MDQPNPIVEPTKVVEPKVEEKKDDLITRVSQVKEPPKEESKFNINDLDSEITKITDENLKNQMLNLKKSLISGENQKYQELAKLRKDYEQKLAETSTWTPEKIQSLLKDPTFVESAQSVVGTQQEDTSMLTEAEKKELKELKEKIKHMETQAWLSSKTQQDEALKSRYANYDSQIPDIITNELLMGKRQATREDLWKVYDYESAVKRAYELGRQDRKPEIEEKTSSSSIEGGTITSTETPPPKEPGESDRAYFVRLGERRLRELVNRKK